MRGCLGGVRGCSRGVCIVFAGGVRGFCRGVCMVFAGAGPAWFLPGGGGVCVVFPRGGRA